MKKKNAFFLSETIVVITIVAIVLLLVFKTYSGVYVKFKETTKYNTVSATAALRYVNEYFKTIEYDPTTVLNGSAYADITNDSTFASAYYSTLKETLNIDKIYLINFDTIYSSNINVFDLSFRKYLKTLETSKNGIGIVLSTKENQYSSILLEGSSAPKLVGDEENEYAAFVEIGSDFVDPGYTNWNGSAPITEWETAFDKNTEGIYYLRYNFNGYLLRRKVVVLEAEKTYTYTGSYQIFNVTYSGKYQIELWGAQGADSQSLGGYTSGKIMLVKDEKIYIYIGKGLNKVGNSTIFNGGTGNSGGYNGGGSTDIRLVNGDWNNTTSINSRVMVAAGSGSGSGNSTKSLGYGGGLIGGTGGGTYGGTQIAPGAVQSSSYTASSFGIANGGCSGGNGYYPGGGASCGNGAGGGSSFISGHTGCVAIISSTSTSARTGTGGATCTTGTTDNLCSVHYSGKVFTNTLMIDGAGYTWTNSKSSTVGTNLMPNPEGGTYASGVGHSGNGYARITYIGSSVN